MRHNRAPGNRERGFTIIEPLVSMIISLMLLAAAYSVLITQVRSFEMQRGKMDARETLRGAASLLTSELRAASSSRGDLYAIAPQTITLRSLLGSGVICDTLGIKYGAWQPHGDFQATAADSVLIFSHTSLTWHSVKVSQVWTDPAAGGIPTCDWGEGSSLGWWCRSWPATPPACGLDRVSGPSAASSTAFSSGTAAGGWAASWPRPGATTF